MLLCSNNSYYTGFTTDMIKRYRAHLDGTGSAKYTRSFKPLKIAQCWRLENAPRGTALRIEAFIKRQPRSQKQLYVDHPQLLARDFTEQTEIAITLIAENTIRLEAKSRQD